MYQWVPHQSAFNEFQQYAFKEKEAKNAVKYFINSFEAEQENNLYRYVNLMALM